MNDTCLARNSHIRNLQYFFVSGDDGDDGQRTQEIQGMVSNSFALLLIPFLAQYSIIAELKRTVNK